MPEKLSDSPSRKPRVTLTPEEAEKLLATGDEHEIESCLERLINLDEDTARVLSQYDGTFSFSALTHLDACVVKALIGNKQEDCYSFDGLKDVDAAFIKAFAGTECTVYLVGLAEIDVTLAEALATGASRIFFDTSEGSAHIGGQGLLLVFSNAVHISQEAMAVLKGQYLRGNVIIMGETCPLRNQFLGIAERDTVIESSEMAPWRPLFERYPNFKELVLDEDPEIQTYLKENGVTHPERFHNLNAGRGAEAVIEEVLQFIGTQPNGFGIEAFSEMFISRTRKDFSSETRFLSVYLDETLQALHDHLQSICLSCQRGLRAHTGHRSAHGRSFLEEKINDPQLSDRIKARYRRDLQRLLSHETSDKTGELEAWLKSAQELLDKLKPFHLKRPGQVSYQLGSRSVHDLTLGDKCSDCTSAKIHGMNFWTVPTWLTDPGFNFLLQYDEEGRLAHKFGLVWELRAEKGKQVPILTIDSLELANEQKEKGGMYVGPADSIKEKRLMRDAMAFIRSWAADMGLDSKALYSSTVSNTGTMELDADYVTKSVTITKLGVLDASKRILKKTNPEYDGEVKVYLQSLVTQDQQLQMAQGQDGAEGHAALIEGEKGRDFAAVEQSFDQFLRSDSPDVSTVRSILELARTDSEAAARQMRVFLATQAKQETKQVLAVGSQRIDVFLHARGHSLEVYLKSILGQTEVSRGAFVKAKLFHLVSNKK